MSLVIRSITLGNDSVNNTIIMSANQTNGDQTVYIPDITNNDVGMVVQTGATQSSAGIVIDSSTVQPGYILQLENPAVTAKWIQGTGGGEYNDGSNRGTESDDAKGLFYQKNGTFLEFKRIRSISSTSGILLTASGDNNYVDIDLAIDQLAEDTDPQSTDYLATYDTDATAHKRVLLDNLLKNLTPTIYNNTISVTTDFSLIDPNTTGTTSSTYVLMNGMTITPSNAGKYFIIFNGTWSVSSKFAQCFIIIRVGSTNIASSEKKIIMNPSNVNDATRLPISTHCIETVEAAESIYVYWKEIGDSYTFYMFTRSLSVIRLN